MNNGDHYVRAVEAERELQDQINAENEFEFRAEMQDTGMAALNGVAIEDFDISQVKRSGNPKGVMSPSHVKPGTQQIGNYDAATGERILPPEPEEPGFWESLKQSGMELAETSAVMVANQALYAAGIKEDIIRRIQDTTADLAIAVFGVGEEDVVRGEEPQVPYHRSLADPKVEAWGAEFSRTIGGYAIEFGTATGALRATLGAPTTVAGGYAQMVGAGAVADFTMDPRYESLIDGIAAVAGIENELMSVINPAEMYETSPLRARGMMAVEGGVVGGAVDTVLYGARAATRGLAMMRAQADELEEIGAERIRKSTYSVNAGVDAEAMWGMVEVMAAKIIKGAEALTPDIKRELAASGATPAQMRDAWTAATEVAEKGIEREMSARAKMNMANLSQGVPGFREVADNLTEEELEYVTRSQAEQLVNVFNQLDPEQMAAAALGGQAKKGWYRESADALLRVFGPEDSHRFTALLSAMSPQTSVESNLRNAVAVWRNWTKAGRPTDPADIKRIMGESVEGEKGEESILDAWVNNSLRALTAEDPRGIVLSGPKVQSFYRNLTGDLDEVTNDAWMANYGGVDQAIFGGAGRASAQDEFGKIGVKGGGYLGMSARARDVAKRLTEITGEDWTPAEVQETVWSYAKTLYESRKSEGYLGKTSRELMEDLTPEQIRETPDFGTLLGEGEYGAPLREVEEYAGRLDELAAERAAGRGEALEDGARQGGATPESRALGDVADRLDKLYAKRNIPQITADARKGIDLGARPDARGAVPGPYKRSARKSRTDALNVPGWKHTIDKDLGAKFEKLGAANPKWVELEPTEQGADAFSQAINRAKEGNQWGAQVHVYSPEEYADMKLFVTPDGSAGFAIKPDGDLVSVFSDGSQKWVTPSLLTLAVQQGARKLDAFDTHLMALYTEAGFRPVGRAKWNDEFAPEGWDKELYSMYNKGEPDIVTMVYDPAFDRKYRKKDAPYSDDPWKLQQEALENVR